MDEIKDYAVFVKGATKSYGPNKILDQLHMKVPRGCIYGLLGASGCGKTTLLSCIVGRKKLDSGEVITLGGKPGHHGSGVPGPRVGYMPQDIALVAEFTVKDIIYYFGRILDMEDSLINERFQALKKLLDLPPDDRFIKSCSGGQQRRVSFAAAMIHKPELLILDEPTVGLDPLLRDSIWKYLVEISEKEQITVIITTHYIEEAKHAHKVGLMREGRLLAEESPERLLTLFGVETLEDVFLSIIKQQSQPHQAAGSLQNITIFNDHQNTGNNGENAHLSVIDLNDPISKSIPMKSNYPATGTFALNKRRMKALMSKNIKQFIRNIEGIIFAFVMPLLQMLSFFIAIGGDVKNIPIGVVNDESLVMHCSNYTKNGTISYSTDCEFHDLGCRFLDEVNDPMINLIYYDELDEAIDDIKHGDIVGVMYIYSNFSESFEVRLNDAINAENEIFNNSQIQVWLDMSNRQIGASVKYKLIQKCVDFQVSIFKDCNLLPKLGEIPLRINYEYGEKDDNLTIFMVPGILLTVTFFLGTILTSTIIVTDRLEGVWDRSIVAGVSSLEIILTHLATQFVVLFLQTIEIIVVAFFIFGIDYVGKMWIIFLYVISEGLTGMVFGFLISIICNTHIAARIFASGFFLPMFLLSGIIWSFEGQPPILRFISQLMPLTIPILSLRNVIKKGYDISHLEVLDGIGVILVWIILLSIASMLAIKRKR